MELQRYAEVVGVPNEVILLPGLLNARDIDITGVIAITTHFTDEATETQSWGLARKNLAVELPLLITLLSVWWIVPGGSSHALWDVMQVSPLNSGSLDPCPRLHG